MELYHYILILGAIFVVTVHIGYFGILNNQFILYQKRTHRLQILSTRLALFLPACSIIIYLQIAVAELNIALQIPLSIAEALAFYTFLSYIQNIFGSPNATILAIDHELPRPNPGPIIAFFMKFYSRDATILYRRLMLSLYHVLITRPIVIVFQVVCGYLIENPAAKAANTVFAIGSMAIMMNGFITLLVFYERAHPGCHGTKALTKLAIFKLAILLPVFQDFIVRLLINHAKQRKGITATEVRIHQMNDIVLLGEMMFLAFPMYFIFSAQINNRFQAHMLSAKGKTGIKNNTNTYNYILGENSQFGYPKKYSSVQGSAGFSSLFEWDSVAIGIQKDPENEIKWKCFVYEVLNIADMYGTFVNEVEVIESSEEEEEEMGGRDRDGYMKDDDIQLGGGHGNLDTNNSNNYGSSNNGSSSSSNNNSDSSGNNSNSNSNNNDNKVYTKRNDDDGDDNRSTSNDNNYDNNNNSRSNNNNNDDDDDDDDDGSRR